MRTGIVIGGELLNGNDEMIRYFWPCNFVLDTNVAHCTPVCVSTRD
jgi:hypothetical protein